jgi:aminopeptidase
VCIEILVSSQGRETGVTDPRIERWASVLTEYSVEVQPGDVVGVTGGAAAEPLLRAIYRHVVARGGHPVLVPSFSGQTNDLIALGTDEQLTAVSPVERFLRAEADVLISVTAETNTRTGSGLDPERQRRYNAARAELRQIFLRRAAEGALRWTSTLYPTDAHAQDADMPTADFAEFMFRACKLHEPDPAEAWRKLAAWQARLIDWLRDKHEIHVVGPDTDLRLSVTGRTWINSDGHRNFPSGEIFTGPVETSVEGVIRCSFPVVTAGREIADIRLRFQEGRVVEASAAREETYLLSALNTDPGARYLGEFAFGTNFDITRFTKNILLDEKIGGTIHVALGAGYPDTGSVNQSAIHWDLICDVRSGGIVTVDGEVFLQDGRFVIAPE